MTRWSADGQVSSEAYAARFEELAASGADVHGEAALCESLVPVGASVLDAGCGTGRVAIRLASRGYAVVGVDIEASMLEVARTAAPELRWLQADLSVLDLGETFELVVAAGNILPLVAEGTEPAVLSRLAAHVADGGVLVTGFGLDRAHLPDMAGLVSLAELDAWCAEAGLLLERRCATWDGQPYDGGGYAVSIHRKARTGE